MINIKRAYSILGGHHVVSFSFYIIIHILYRKIHASFSIEPTGITVTSNTFGI